MAGRYRALIIDDEPDILELLALTLGRMDVDSDQAMDISNAIRQLAHHHYDLCLTDMRLPDGSGIDLVEHIQQNYPTLPVAVITAHGNVEAAVTALKMGAFDFVSKPVDLTILRNLVTTALRIPGTQTQRIDRRSRHLLLGESDAIRNIRSKITKLARSQAPIYISGESGTGKELVARLIHAKGPRAEKSFVPVNCGAIPEQLMESEFFGHKKGSFTGAVTDKAGLFQAADGGTLFLDEVADLPLQMQVKLLRAIQEKAIRPLGSQTEQSVDIRILCATHKDLSKMVKEGEFRQDLFYRINVIELHVPNIASRREDIPQLAEHFLDKITTEMNIEKPTLSDEALQQLQHYPFPGNVRELENILERAITLCEDNTISADDLQLPNHPAKKTLPPPEKNKSVELESYLDSTERRAIIDALEKTRYNKTAAAKLLGLSFRQLRYRLKKLNIN